MANTTSAVPTRSLNKTVAMLLSNKMIEDEFKEIADDLEELNLDPHATLHHEVMSDSLVWSDELLHGKGRKVWCMRPVFRYRTGLILGLDIAQCKQHWEIGRTIFPNWIGFAPWRCERDLELEAQYWRLSGKRKL